MKNNFYGFSFADEMRTVLESATFVFIILKLTDVIDWSWWWVTSTFTIPFTLAFITMIIEGTIRYLKEKKMKNNSAKQ
jgi:hypothetical protein